MSRTEAASGVRVVTDREIAAQVEASGSPESTSCAEGWQPWGGFQNAGHEGDSVTFYGQQAMVKYGDTQPTAVAAEAEAEEVLPAEAEALEQLRAA